MATLTPLPHRHGQNIRDKACILSSVFDIKHPGPGIKKCLMRGVDMSDSYHDLSLSRAHWLQNNESKLIGWGFSVLSSTYVFIAFK